MTRLAGSTLAVLLLVSETGGVDPVERALDDAALAIRKEAFVPAHDKLDGAVRVLARRPDPAAQARAHRLLGILHDSLGEPDVAAREYATAIALARGAGDRRAEAAALRDCGFGHWRRAEYDDAERFARAALSPQVPASDRAGEGASVDLLGRIALKVGRTDEALTLLQRAAGLRAAGGDRYGEVESRLAVAQTYLERREFDLAMAEARDLEQLGADLGDRAIAVQALTHTAITWMVQGAPGAALEVLARARALAEAPADPALLARVRYLEANALRARGDHERAIAAHDDAIAAFAALGNRREEAWNHARRGRSLALLGRSQEAEASLARALDLWEQIHERRASAYWTYDRGRLLERLGRFEEARDAWEDALRLEDEIALPYEALILGDMAWLAARMGEPAEARSLVQRAVAAAELSEIPEMLWSALYRAAQVERRAGDRVAALAFLDRCLEVIEDMRRRVVPFDESLVGFLEDKQEVFAESVDLRMELGRAEEALATCERARARAFVDLLADHPETRAAELPVVAALRGAARRHGAAIVEYFVGRSRTFVWVLAPGEPVRAATIPIGAAGWAGRIAALRGSFGDGTGQGAGDPGAILRDLERDLWEPAAPWLRSGDRVTVVPHGPLLTLPFASLVDPHGRYLVETLTLDYAPSIAAVGALDAREAAGGGCLAIGNPTLAPDDTGASPLPALPAAEAEAAFAAQALPPGRVLTGAGATEGQVRALAPEFAWLHFATHGVIRDDDPLDSAVLLARSEGGADDGRLTAREILDLPLRARLVTLAACDSGLGRVSGEGMLGLWRSFLHAGADAVVVSLWGVSDRVGGFQMSRFYGALADGAPPARALRRAQLDTLEALRRGELRTASGRALPETPLLWAPYVVVGSGGV